MKSIGPVIDKTEAFIISEIFQKSEKSQIYIGKDDREIINIKNKLSWLLPNQLVLLYKALQPLPMATLVLHHQPLLPLYA